MQSKQKQQKYQKLCVRTNEEEENVLYTRLHIYTREPYDMYVDLSELVYGLQRIYYKQTKRRSEKAKIIITIITNEKK